MSTLAALKVVNNPVKVLGPVQTALCSALTEMFLSGHFEQEAESTRDVMFTVFCRLFEVPTESTI